MAQRVFGWLVTGPLGHLAVGALEWARIAGRLAWARWRGRPVEW